MNKLKNIKIAFVDIDGTISNSNKQITKETNQAIENATKNGLIVVLCSGRSNDYVYKYSKLANASPTIISCNGALIFDYKQNKNILQNKINFEQVKLLWNYCNENSIHCLLNGKNKRYCNSINYFDENNTILIRHIDNLKNENIYQFVAGCDFFEPIYNLDCFISQNTNLKIVNASNGYINRIKNENHYFLDITNDNVNKGIAIKKLLVHLNLKKENSIGFGDHINDFDLFKEVGFKIAMDNAMNDLKKQADFITLSNDDNGVAYFLNNFIDYEKKIYDTHWFLNYFI